MKTQEELNALKEELETVSKELHELTEEELVQVAGGDFLVPDVRNDPGAGHYVSGTKPCTGVNGR